LARLITPLLYSGAPPRGGCGLGNRADGPVAGINVSLDASDGKLPGDLFDATAR